MSSSSSFAAAASSAASGPTETSAPTTSARPSGDRRPPTSVVVLAGGLSHERDVSLRSGRRVAEALRSADVDVAVLDVDADLVPALRDLHPDLVWPLLHGASGEDGSVQDMIQLLGYPILGTGPRASRVAWSKPIAKRVVAQAGLATPDFVTLPQSLFRELGASRVLEAVVSRLGLPLVVKPASGGSALGVSLVMSAEDLPRAMVDCFAYGDTALIEHAVVGTEVAVSVIDTGSGPTALPVVEIVTDGPYDFDARYNPGRTEYFTPARLEADLAASVAAAGVAAHTALGLERLSRTDLIVTDDGVVHFLEVNIAPGMTETSLFPQAVEASGHNLGDLYRSLVTASLAT